MFVPYHADVVMHRWPIANWVLIGLTVVVSCGMFLPLGQWEEEGFATVVEARAAGEKKVELPPPEGVLDYFLLQPHHFHPSQLIGHTFVHAGIWHLLGNMIFLWVFGNAINAKLGQWQYLALYFGVAIFQGVVYVVAGPRVPSMGASGAIMGIVGAFFVLYPRNDIRVGGWLVYRPLAFSISAMWLIGISVAMDIWGLAVGGNSGIAYISHVAGAGIGVAVIWVLLDHRTIESDATEENILQVMGLQAKSEPVRVSTFRPEVPLIRAAPAEPPKPLPPLELD